MFTCLTLALGMHLGTNHDLPPGTRFTDINPGLYLRCDQNVIGVFRNSIGRTSVYGAHLVYVAPGVDVAVGMTTGYGSRPTPLLALQYRTGAYRVSFIPTTPLNRGGMHLTKEF